MQNRRSFTSLKSTFDKKKELKQYLNLSLDMFCVCDLNGQIMYINQSFNTITGYSLEDLEDRTFSSIIYAKDSIKLSNILSKHKKDKKPIQRFHCRFLTKNGNITWLSWNIVFDELEELCYFSAREVTKSHEEQEQLRLFGTAFDKAKEGIIIAENIGTYEKPNPVIIYANQAFLNYSGYQLADIIGQNPRMMRGSNENKAVLANIREAIKNWESIDVEVKNQTKHGEDIWVSLSISPIVNKEGLFTHWISIQKDITERVVKENKLRMFESVVVNSKDSVMITAAEPLDYPNGPKIVYVNDAFCEMTGFSRAEVIGNTPRILQGKLTSDIARKKMNESLKKWEPFQIDILNYKKNNETFWVELSIVPVADENGCFTHWVSIQRDITERVKLQEGLETKVKERTRALEQSNRKLEAFASVASHDLKAPLRTIVSYLGIFKRRFTQKIGEKTTGFESEFEYLDFAQKGAKEAYDLIQGILKYSQIKSEEGDWEVMDLNIVINDVLLLLQKDIGGNKSKITYNHLPTIKGHKVQIKQLFQNLISNAIKFRGEKPCEVEIKVTRRKEDYLFEVKDNGIGMAEADKKMIFNLFGRAKTTRKYEGQGIGLSLCKEIVEQHNGKIWVESTLGKGSSFYFSIGAK